MDFSATEAKTVIEKTTQRIPKPILMNGRIRRERIEPNFFIVGAARSGTTSLADYLGQHPDIYMCPVKEPSFFISDYGLDDFDEYLSLFTKAGKALAIGEASTGYLFDEHAAQAIHERFPEAKIIIILRNPVDTAFSYWQYMLINGSESKSFEEAISDEERRYRKSEDFKRSCAGWWATYLYLERAMYFNQVKRYTDVFGKDHIKIYIFEEFFRTPEKSCQDVFNFLGVDSSFVPDCKVFNEGGELRFNLVKKIKNYLFPLSQNLLPIKFRDKIGMLIRNINTKRAMKVEMSPTTRKALEEFFHSDIIKLESLLGREIHEWRPTKFSGSS